MKSTENCDICGRGTAQQALTPTWYPHDLVCDRARCRAAARDAVVAIMQSREDDEELVGNIAVRHEGQMVPWGFRDDTMAKMDVVENRDWWATNVVKQVRT